MRFRVEWLPLALGDLTGIWLAANPADRIIIAAAAHDLDRKLEVDPAKEGESRSHGERVMFQPPLAITYRIQPRLSLVEVLEAWRTRPPRGHGPRITDN